VAGPDVNTAATNQPQAGTGPHLALSGSHPQLPPDLHAHSCPVNSLSVAEIARW
jgi:hypothetical protein